MQPLTIRSDLTDVAARHAPTNACATAMKENRAVVLGGFASPGTLPCWILRVTSRRKSTWLISVAVDEVNLKYVVTYPDEVPYQDWIGQSNGKRQLIDGDIPMKMSFERMKARRRATQTNEDA